MSTGKKYHRVWVDGCYDMTHFGHYNFIRQASEIGDEVVVGIHTDEEIARNKAPPVFNLEERVEMVKACKWVHEVVPGAPYTCDPTWLDKYHCEVSVHGDDIVMNADGEDCYTAMRKQGRFATVPRTKSISTTNLIGRMLRLPASEMPDGLLPGEIRKVASSSHELHTYIPSTRRIAQFSNTKEPNPGDRIVYVDGAFDLLHAGHASFLRKAKELGDYLIVGIHTDEEIAARSMSGMPIMTLQERVLNVLAMKYVDDVIIGAPYQITNDFLDQIQPAVVAAGSAETSILRSETDSFRIPKERGIFKTIQSDFPNLTAVSVVHRIMKNYALYAKRNQQKEATAYEQANMTHS